MAIKIRLARAGAKKRPFYRIVVANSTAPRDGDFIEKLGTYNPLLSKDSNERVVLKNERIAYWLSQGACPTEVVCKFLVASGIELPKFVQKSIDARQKGQVARPKREKK